MAEERKPGEVLDDRYRLVEPLGRGGFGDVWRAEELLPDGTSLRQVALKLLRGQAVGHDWSAEARIIASLRHPALVTIYAAGLLGRERVPFVAMELLEGVNLASFVSSAQPLPWRRVLAWAREAAAALDEIHRANVVHLDLKPANLFLSEQGRVKVLDFGIARHGLEPAVALPTPEPLDEMSTAAFMAAQEGDTVGAVSTSRFVVGTPGFMAPEIFEDGEATHASDAYALAACIVEIATGELPQDVGARRDETKAASTTAQTWFAQVQSATVRGEIRDLRADHPELPEALVALLERWLALDPAARGVARGGLRAELDAIWSCPHGHLANPYRGLLPYRVIDEGRFYGRSADAVRVARELYDAPCAIMQGDGAIGLQSLALAGVVPALGRSFADGRHDWRCCELTLEGSRDADRRVREALEAFLDANGAPADGAGLVERLSAWASQAQVGAVVVLDDLHQLVSGDEAPLLDELVARLADRHPGLRLVGTLRSEHSAAFFESALGRRLRPWVRFIGPLGASAIDEVVRRPAHDARRKVEGAEAIVDELQGELSADGARLPLVSLALTDWWQTEGPLDAARWREGGGLVGRLCRHAERTVASFEDPELAEEVLVRLVAVDGSLVEVAESDLIEAVDAGERGARAVASLVEARVLVRRAELLRLSHPRLADRWPRLDGRRLADIDRLTFLDELGQAAHRWGLAGRPRRLLWGGQHLDKARRWLPEVGRELADDERTFVEASLAARRLSWALRAVLVLCAIAAIAGGTWFDGEMDRRARAQAETLERARLTAALEGMVSRARRVDNPYLKVALLSGALSAGAADPTLALELGSTARDMPAATFLALDRVAHPGFHWGPRWLVGGVGREIVVYDFDPPAGPEFAPAAHRFPPHEQGMANLVPLLFDTSFVTRGIDGELKVWRLREDGSISLAAIAPMRCQRGLSQIIVAAAAPVIACSTEDGLARWDLRRPAEVSVDPFRGRALHLSDDGRWLAAVWLGQVLLWDPQGERRHLMSVDRPPAVARFSPRDPVVALVSSGAFHVYDLAGAAPRQIFSKTISDPDPVAARWDEGGLHLAICDYTGVGQQHYLRRGGRDPADEQPPARARPCDERRHRWPAPLENARAYDEALTSSYIGPRIFEGGWALSDGRIITRDLVMFDLTDRGLRQLLEVAVTKPSFELGVSTQMVFAHGDRMVWQVGERIQMLDRRGEPLQSRPGHLLMHCPDGRLLAWRKSSDGNQWEIFDAAHDVVMRRVVRRPGFVLGADPSCARVWFQAHDGTLGSLSVEGDTKAVAFEEVAPAGGGYAFDGYVFDARPSRGASGQPDGVWLAGSSGAMVRAAADGSLAPFGNATPRPALMADGPNPGDLIFADETGVVLRSAGAARDTLLLGRQSERAWEDAMVLDARHLLLSWAHGVAVVDFARREIVGTAKTPGLGRLARWDEGGSVLVWPFSFMGEPRGEIIPFGRDLAAEVGDTASNLRARLDASKQIVIGLD